MPADYTEEKIPILIEHCRDLYLDRIIVSCEELSDS